MLAELCRTALRGLSCCVTLIVTDWWCWNLRLCFENELNECTLVSDIQMWIGVVCYKETAVVFMTKLRLDLIHGMAATICYRIVSTSSLPSKNMKSDLYINIIFLIFLLFFCVGGELGLSYWGRNVGWECSRRGCGCRRLVATGTR